jgi:hypothetical protein
MNPDASHYCNACATVLDPATVRPSAAVAPQPVVTPDHRRLRVALAVCAAVIAVLFLALVACLL